MKIMKKNRLDAFCDILPKRESRKTMIKSVLSSGDPRGMTAEEIAAKLHENAKIPYVDMNFVRPRLTEMQQSGDVSVVGKRRSTITGKNTSIWKIAKK